MREKVLILKTKEIQKAQLNRADNKTCSSPLSKLTLKLVYIYQISQPHGNQISKQAAIL